MANPSSFNSDVARTGETPVSPISHALNTSGPSFRASRITGRLFPLVPLLLSVIAGIACFKAAGATLGFFFGGIFFAAVLTSPLALAVSSTVMRVINVAMIILGISAVWLFGAVSEQGATLAQCGGCIIVLASFAIGLAAFAGTLQSLRFNPFIAVATTGLLALAWLTWPIWLSPALTSKHGEALVRWLVPAHPLLTINGLLSSPDATPDNWNERSIAYHLTNLGNDVPYDKPISAWPSSLAHLGIGGLCMLMMWTRRRKSSVQ